MGIAKKTGIGNKEPNQKEPKSDKEILYSDSVFPVVGIGASAGGLASIESFFKSFPADSEINMSFVIIQHLDPNHKSILTDLISQYTSMNVNAAKEGVRIKPNSVYVIPPNYDLSILNKTLHLEKRNLQHTLHLPIDYFFRTLAEDQHENAIGIVLSGTGTDGTLGIKAIKGEGGIAIAETTETAAYDGMPQSALSTGMIDFVLPPDEIPNKLLSYTSRIYKDRIPTKPVIAPKTEETLKQILTLLRSQTGHDFSDYKRNTINRRVERRMVINQIDSINDYYLFLKQNSVEIETLFKELLINVTNFFRDKPAFESFNEKIIPELFKDRDPSSPIRVWVAGCSTGEEAYSLAIIFQEHIEKIKQYFTVQIFATDIDTESVEKARQGLYPENIVSDVSQERLAKYFTKENGNFRIHKSIRDMIVFAK